MAAEGSWGDAFGDMGLTSTQQEDLREELEYRVMQQRILALEAQKRAAARQGERFLIDAGDNGGEVQLQVHPLFYHYWGNRLGYECWNDAEFIREFIRDNEEVRVKNHSRKVMVGHAPAATAGAAVESKPGRFHKSYGVW